MALKKLPLLLILPLVMSGCSLFGGEKKDFDSLYKAHIEDQIGMVRDFAEELGYKESYKTSGSLELATEIPAILSGALSAGYEGKVRGQDVELSLLQPTMRFETLLASGSAEAKNVSLISKAGDAYFRFEELKSVGLIEESVTEVIQGYNNTWLSILKSELEKTLSGSSEEDILAYKLSESLSQMTLTDIEEYLTKYPLWNSTKDLGMNEKKLHIFQVEFAKENVIAMIGAFTEKSTGVPLSEEAKNEIRNTLGSIQFSGIMGFDPKKAGNMSFEGNLQVGSGESLQVSGEL
jgi:hypothetical protein